MVTPSAPIAFLAPPRGGAVCALKARIGHEKTPGAGRAVTVAELGPERGAAAVAALGAFRTRMKTPNAARTLFVSRLSALFTERGLTLLERPMARASVQGGPNLSVDGERAVLAQQSERVRDRAAHADVRSQIKAAVTRRHESERAPTVGADFRRALSAAQSAYIDDEIERVIATRAAHFGLEREGYLTELYERVVLTGGGRVVRCADCPPVDGTLDVTALEQAGSDLALMAAPDALAAALLHVAERFDEAPPIVQLPGTAVPTARLLDIMQLHTQRLSRDAAGDGRRWAAPLENALVEVVGNKKRARRLLSSARAVRQKAQNRLLRRAPFKTHVASNEAPAVTYRFAPHGARAIARAARALGAPEVALDDEGLRALCAHVAAQPAPKPTGPSLAAPPRYDHLGDLLTEAVRRYDERPALSVFDGDERMDVSYRALMVRAEAVALRLLEAGVQPGDRVVLSAQNHPDWVVCFFGIVLARGVAVPLDPGLIPAQVRTIVNKAQPAGAIVDKARRAAWAEVLAEPVWDVHLMSAPGGPPSNDDDNPLAALDAPAPGDVASILFTSGTTGEPKGVMLTHENFTSLVASLSSLFDMGDGDRALSVLPLHHTLEFSCGLLMPLVAGAQIFYLDALSAERLAFVLKKGRITGMIGVPALWQLLERKIVSDVEKSGEAKRFAFDVLRRTNDALGIRLGIDIGPMLFRQVHAALGGHLRVLVSGGAALPASTHGLFRSLGLHVSEGYGLTESAPVLTLAEAGPGQHGAHVGQAIPGVRIEIRSPDATGAGEVWAQGPNVMAGYFENPEATDAALQSGWLKTGDMGRVDDTGRLVLVGREKDVVVTASGENIYLDDTEAMLSPFPGAEEFCLVGVADDKGGERLALVVYAGEGKTLTERDCKRHCTSLPAFARPQVVVVHPLPLPKTATRKIKRKDTVPLVERHLRAQAKAPSVAAAPSLIDARLLAAVALVAGVDVKTLTPTTGLHTDLGFDSLMWVELQSALSPLIGAIDAEALFVCETIADLAHLEGGEAALSRATGDTDDDDDKIRLPRFFVRGGRLALTAAQRDLYRSLFDTRVTGRANIPHNENVIVVANHQSHLDTGLVKFALGRFGRDLKPLAAQDYFFEGNRFKVAFFENFTNLVALDRKSGSGGAFDVAATLLRQGHSVLIYPEGTRRADGTLGEFKPLVGRLAMATGRAVLPIYLGGTYNALPRGAAVVRARELFARIGAPISANALSAATAQLTPIEQTRAATARIREVIVALRDGTSPGRFAKETAPESARAQQA